MNQQQLERDRNYPKLTGLDGLLYLGSPLSHQHVHIMESRHTLACKVAADLIHDGHRIYCPVAHFYNIIRVGGFSKDWGTWRDQCLEVLSRSDMMLVLRLDEWERSEGLTHEIEFAISRRIPLTYIDAYPSSPFRSQQL